MMKTTKSKFCKIIALLVSAICVFSCLAGCGDSDAAASTDGRNFQQAFLEPINQDEYFIGMCALSSDTTDEVDIGVSSEWIAKNSEALGVQSHRVWLNITAVIERAHDSNELSLNQDMVNKYREFFTQLKAHGVKRIVAMCHGFLYPYNYIKVNKADTGVGIHPLEEPEFYKTWIQMYYECYKLLATTFPEISFWEIGNEPDVHGFFHRNGGADMNDSDTGYIVADLCYAANKALKFVNADNACIYPGLSVIASGVSVLESSYKFITEKKLPTLEDHYMDNPDDYFDIVAWHPYPADEGYERTKRYSDFYYNVMVKYGDAEKRVFFTEIGYSLDPRGKSEENIQEDTDTLMGIFRKIREEMPYVETIFYFRMSELYEKYMREVPEENYYGCFYSPDDPVNLGKPKSLAIEFYKFINGTDADVSPETSPIYWYYRAKTVADV